MFCSYCGQAAAANASSCAQCGKPLHPASPKNSGLVAFTVIFAITTIVAGWAAVYNARKAAQAREALAMVRHFEVEPPPPPPPPPKASGQVTPISPCDAGVEGGVPGGVPGGVIGGVIGEEKSPPSAAAERVRISGGTAQANLISQPPPVYPQLAMAAKVQGAVVLLVDVSRDGKVENARVLSGHPMLVQSAMEAVRQWRYKPYAMNGEPVPIETTVTVNFKLQ